MTDTANKNQEQQSGENLADLFSQSVPVGGDEPPQFETEGQIIANLEHACALLEERVNATLAIQNGLVSLVSSLRRQLMETNVRMAAMETLTSFDNGDLRQKEHKAALNREVLDKAAIFTEASIFSRLAGIGSSGKEGEQVAYDSAPKKEGTFVGAFDRLLLTNEQRGDSIVVYMSKIPPEQNLFLCKKYGQSIGCVQEGEIRWYKIHTLLEQ